MTLTLSSLIIIFTITAVILTAVVGLGMKKQKSWAMTFFQNFCGAWYLFSGWVKAIDPMGTAYKMEDYFAEFESTFEQTWLSFIAPMFPALSEVSIYFSVFMIVLEIILGLALIIGWKPGLVSKIFFGLLVFFTFLTGFTYLTGFVGEGVNFFEFGKWGSVHDENNMKVKDCGCFGDFIKLKPKTSFIKDLFLLIPALYFVFRSKSMHQLFGARTRSLMIGISTIGTLIYCISNFAWDLPHTDFRPFRVNTDVKKQRIAELDAMGSVKILAWKLKNLESGKVVELSNDVFMKEFKSYPKTEWEVIDQVKSEPTMASTKISEMEFTDFEGYDMTDELLETKEPYFTVIAHKLYGEGKKEKVIVKDSIYKIDTLSTAEEGQEMIVRTLDRVEDKEVTKTVYQWDESYLDDYRNVIAPLAKAAKAKGIKTYIITGGADIEMVNQLEDKIQSGAAFLTADNILLKTILRSNPGIVLWQDGKILNKWHKDKFPGVDNVKI